MLIVKIIWEIFICLNASFYFTSSRAKKTLFKRNTYRKDIERTCLNKLTILISKWYGKNCSKSFSDARNSSDIEKEIIKQINTLKPFDMESHKAIPKKPFVSEEDNIEKEINLNPKDRIRNVDYCKCGCECKLMMTFAKSFCLLLRLIFFLNWDSLLARLNNYYKACSYKKKRHKRLKYTGSLFSKNLQLIVVCQF